MVLRFDSAKNLLINLPVHERFAFEKMLVFIFFFLKRTHVFIDLTVRVFTLFLTWLELFRPVTFLRLDYVLCLQSLQLILEKLQFISFFLYLLLQMFLLKTVAHQMLTVHYSIVLGLMIGDDVYWIQHAVYEVLEEIRVYLHGVQHLELSDLFGNGTCCLSGLPFELG